MVPQGISYMLQVSWATVGIIVGVLSAVLTIVGKYLQMTIKNALTDLSASIREEIKREFSSQEWVRGELRLVDLRLTQLETNARVDRAKPDHNHS